MDFLLTGSRVYGPANPDSDLDIVIKAEDQPLIGTYLNEHNIQAYNTPTQDSYGDVGGFYFKLANIEINIIIVRDEAEFEQWARRTEMMKKLPPIEDRDRRLALFNSLL